MPRVEATLSASYQFTAPSLLRSRLNLQPGDKVVFDTDKAVVTVEKAETREETVRRIFADLERMKVEREKHMTPEQKEFAKKTAGWTVRQYHEYIDNLPETKAYLKEKYGV